MCVTCVTLIYFFSHHDLILYAVTWPEIKDGLGDSKVRRHADTKRIESKIKMHTNIRDPRWRDGFRRMQSQTIRTRQRVEPNPRVQISAARDEEVY